MICPSEVSVSVAGAKQMILELTAETEPLNTYDIYYGVGEAVLKSNGKVTGLSLDKSSISLTKKGQTASLKAQISPSDATNKTVKWTSSKHICSQSQQQRVVTRGRKRHGNDYGSLWRMEALRLPAK